MFNLKAHRFHAKMTSLARYTQYLFNLQHNTFRMGMQQHTRLTAYEESAAATACEHERLRYENVMLCSGAHPPLEQDCELQDVYHRLSDAKNGWNYTHMLLDITCAEVETQNAELEERVDMITDPEQQLLELHEQAPPEPADHEEINAMSGVDED
jgi:hypothetical protein